jgi:hypothetical protein
VQAMFADIAPPADAVVDVDDGIEVGDGVYQRAFTSWESPAGDVSIFGFQFSDGRVERHIVDIGGDSRLTSEQARQRAGATRCGSRCGHQTAHNRPTRSARGDR